MKANKKAASVDPTSIGAQLEAIASSLASTTTLSAAQRILLSGRSRRVPDALVELVLKLADTNGGQVAGMPIDVAATRATLTQVSDAIEAAADSRRIAAQMADDALSQRVIVADRIFAIYMALRRLVNTPEGAPLMRAYEEMTATVRARKRSKRTTATTDSASAPASQSATTQPAPAPPAAKPAVTAPAATAPAANPTAN